MHAGGGAELALAARRLDIAVGTDSHLVVWPQGSAAREGATGGVGRESYQDGYVEGL